MKDPLRIVFAGTPDFAALSLSGLLTSGCELLAVYTQPDRPAGRGRKLSQSPVKRLALEHELPVFQPKTLRDPSVAEILLASGADVFVVAAYGLILPKNVVHGFPLGCVNVHASLLPRWRGAAPIQRAVLAGDTVTGVSIMRMEEGLDTGPVYTVQKVPIGETETGGSLHDKLAQAGAQALLRTLVALAAGNAKSTPQTEEGATYATRLSKREARLEWSLPAAQLARCVRAFDPWPVAYAVLGDGSHLRIWQAEAVDCETDQAPGTVVAAGAAGLDVKTTQGCLRIKRVQTPGKRAVTIRDYLNARPINPGAPLSGPT